MPMRALEEEALEGRVAENWYPVQIGQVFKRRYEVICKLGFGGTSTVWLAKDHG